MTVWGGNMKINTVLVADDSDRDRLDLVSILLERRYALIEAYNGEDALEKTLTHMPDLLFLDVSMPVLNGFQVARKLSKNSATAHIPIIIVGTDKHTQERWALRQGARAYAEKPLDMRKIFSVITEMQNEEPRGGALISEPHPKETLSLGITDQFIVNAEQQLTEYVGPLARMLVRQAAERARDKNEFYYILAKQIPDEQDREAFLSLWYDELV